MSRKPAEGDLIRLSDRESVAADAKTGLFYPYYRGLTGQLSKLYPDGTALVTIDPESLPEEIRARHEASTTAMRQKWLDGLSDEARNRLSASERKFALRYSLLVAVEDLIRVGSPPRTDRAAGQAAEPVLDLDGAPESRRKTTAELEAEEARHLEEMRKKAR